MFKWFPVLIAGVCLCGCGTHPQPQSFTALSEEFLYQTLAFSPSTATQAGYHNHHGVDLDFLLDDYSESSIEAQRRWFQDFRLRLERSVRPETLNTEDRADYDLLEDQISLQLLDLLTIQNYKHNPTLYVEIAGNAVYTPFILEYADKTTRFRQIISRLEQMPRFLQQAKTQLVSAPDIWVKVAKSENEGNIGLIDQEMRNAAPQNLRAAYNRAVKPAIDALTSFNTYLDRQLSTRSYSWQLGRDNYAQKFRFVLATDQTPGQVLAAAQEQLKQTRQQMFDLALPMWQKLHPEAKARPELNQAVSEVLNKIAEKHATPETYFAEAKKDLEEATQFVKTKDLLTLPKRANLQVIETPEFLRGIYSVGGFSPAPALQPELGAFYWITPIPATWTKDRIESKLREYDTYGLKILTIHEAMPGHYVQFEYANDIQPPSRRAFRSVFGNGPYIEGWAVYATQLMLDAGYMDNNPEMRLSFMKQALRVYGNTILDVRMQTMGMTDQQAMDLMINDTFQEQEEARGKLQRVKLSSTQLPTYFVGWRDWLRLRERYKEVHGADFSLKEFHERALKEGALPLPVLSHLITGMSL
jgi:uncharacterized protein (DUF885 family)